MDALEEDYASVLLADHEPPCLSLYQPTHRHHPENQQNPIRFHNLVKELEASLQQKYSFRETDPLLAPFFALANDPDFWRRTLDGLAVLATADIFKVYRLQRPVPELAVAAESFHTKPLIRILQSADRFQILGLDRHGVRLFEGNRDVVDEIAPAPGVPRTLDDALGREDEGPPERRNRVNSAEAPGATTRHGTGVRRKIAANERERFFRAVDRAVLEHHSRPGDMPLLLAALPEHHHAFRAISDNPFLLPEAIDVHPDDLSPEALRERAWRLVQPYYLERLGGLIERFGAARAAGRAAGDVAEIAMAAAGGRVDTLLIEAERVVPGTGDTGNGRVTFGELDHPDTDDLLDDLGERTLRTGGDVVIVPAARMPTATGLAAIYRY